MQRNRSETARGRFRPLRLRANGCCGASSRLGRGIRRQPRRHIAARRRGRRGSSGFKLEKILKEKTPAQRLGFSSLPLRETSNGCVPTFANYRKLNTPWQLCGSRYLVGEIQYFSAVTRWVPHLLRHGGERKNHRCGSGRDAGILCSPAYVRIHKMSELTMIRKSKSRERTFNTPPLAFVSDAVACCYVQHAN